MEKATIDSIIKEILNYDKIDLSAFYKLSNKYGKSTVLKAFEQLKSLKDNGALSENYLLSKYSDVLILAEVDKLEGSVKDCERFYAKYGKKYVDTFVEHLLDLINPNDEEFAKYEFLINNQYEEEDKENIFDLSIIGNSKVDHFRDYLNYISNFKLLSDDELRELFIKYHNGDKKAEKRINESNLRLVVSIAKKYRFTTYELMDLVQDGNIGLMKAVERFDIDNGCKFSTYATWWIRQAILRGISNNSHTIRIPVHMIERIRKINEFSKSFQNKYGVEPTEDEIASEFPNLTKEDIIYAKNTASKQTTASLYAPVKVGNGETESSTLADMLPNDDLSPEELYIQNEEKEKLLLEKK